MLQIFAPLLLKSTFILCFTQVITSVESDIKFSELKKITREASGL